MRSGGNSRRSELSDLFQFAATLGIHRELCAWPNWHSERAGHWHTRHSREQGLWQWQGERHAGQCLGAPRRPPPARPRQRCRARLQQLPEPSTFLQPPDLAYTPKIEIFHSWNRTAPFVSSDTTRRADHYGVLRYGRLQRVVSRLQVKVWSALAGGHRVSCLHPPWRGMEPRRR